MKEAGQADGKEVENHTASLAEVKDHSEKENGAATNVPNGEADPHVANQTSHERGQLVNLLNSERCLQMDYISVCNYI